MKLWAHLRALWPRWTLLPALPFLAVGVFWIIRGEFRWDHLAMVTVLPFLAYFSAKTKRFFVGMLPFFLMGVVYDTSRLIKNWGLTESNVHTCDLWALEKAIFGIRVGGQKIAFADYFHDHHWLPLDFLCAVPYATYFVVPLVYCGYLYFRDFRTMQRFGWAFLAMSVVGMITWHLWPAAPPWYIRIHGCVVDLSAPNSAGEALLRVDAATGVAFYQGMYSRAAMVFGAMPSLHVAYPLLTVLTAWKRHGWPLRAFLVAFYLSMCFAAVYLDHHWVADLVVGSGYAIIARLVVWRLLPHQEAP